MRSVEATAKTRQEAIKKALDQLGAELHEVQIEILDEGSRGIFGLGARDVKVKLTLEPDVPTRRRPERDKEKDRDHERPRGERERADRGDRGRRGGERPSGERPSGERPSGERPSSERPGGERSGTREARPPRQDRPERGPRPERPERGPRPERPERGPRPERAPRPERGQQRPERPQQQRAERPERPERLPRQRREEPREPREPQKPRPAETAPPAREKATAPAYQEGRDIAPVSDSRRQEATALLGEIVAKMGIEAQVTSSLTEDGRARINVESADSAILIGRKGRNLEALQYLLNRMMRPEEGEISERFIVDIESYLDRRRESLEEMARHFAERAKETGRDVRVKPLSPQERRIIHLTLQDDPDVRTFSLGSSSIRTVVISPKNATRPGGGREGGGRPRRSRGGGRRNGRGESQEPASKPAAVATDDEEIVGHDEEIEDGDAQES